MDALKTTFPQFPSSSTHLGQMAPNSIELKIISGKDLKAFNFFQKLSVYATVSISTEDDSDKKPGEKRKQTHQQQKTGADKEGDGNPEWKHEIRFNLKEIVPRYDYNHIFLEFHLISEAVLFPDKTIGEVRVPFTDLIDGPSGAVRYITYQVRTPDGNPNGVLHFSYKVIDDQIGSLNGNENGSGSGKRFYSYKVIDDQIGSLNGNGNGSGSGKRFYPVIDTSDLQVNSPSHNISYPPPQNHYPPPQAPPPPESYYQSLEPCSSVSSPVYPPPPPLHPMVYYPPPPPSPQPQPFMQLPVPPHAGYYARPPPPLAPYAYGYGGYEYPVCAYPTVEHLSHQRDEDGDMWPKAEEFRTSWNVR